MKKQKNNKVISYRGQMHFSFIAIVFIAVFVYLAAQVIGYLVKDQIEVYEIEAPITYSLNPTYTGIITRTEINYMLEQEGYVNYYVYEGKKARVGATVLTVDETGEFSTLLKKFYPEGISMGEENLASIKESLVRSSSSYSGEAFQKFYEDKYYINASVLETLNLSALDAMDTETVSGFKEVTTPVSGFILYQKDSFDNRTPKDITMQDFDKTTYQKERFGSEQKRAANTFAYKCVPNDSFQITFPISEEDEQIYGEDSYITIYLDALDVTVNGSFSLTTSSDGQRMGVIELNKYGSSYLDERYIDFSIEAKDIAGLRIPVSSIVTKELFTIPKDYLTTGGESSSRGVNKAVNYNGQSSVSFTAVTVMKTEDEVYLIRSADIQAGDVLVKPDSGEQYTVGEKESMTGVYSVNQGYTVFRRADVLGKTKDGGYYIIDSSIANGINAYDRIVLDASLTEEDQIIY